MTSITPPSTLSPPFYPSSRTPISTTTIQTQTSAWYRRLAVNGVPGEIANRLDQHARADRIRTIRGNYSRKLLIGVELILAAVVIFCACWSGLGFIPRILLYPCLASLGIGAWKAIDGFSGYFMAPSKTGISRRPQLIQNDGVV